MKLLNFGGIEKKYTELKTAKIVVRPVPYDGTCTWIEGADQSPTVISKAVVNIL